MENLLTGLQRANSILWGPIMLVLLLGTGVIFTWKLKWIQVRKLGGMVQETFRKSDPTLEKETGMSPFQALSTAIAAQVGTGNLAGVATAIAAGGPGAIFWMWISGFFGMGTIFAEAVLAQIYKAQYKGIVTGGPAYYIRDGLKKPILATIFSVAIVFALAFMGSMVQSNSISQAFHQAFGVPPLLIGLVVSVIVGFVIMGGMNRIASFSEKVVPFMALVYIIGCLIIISQHSSEITRAFAMIFQGAFNPTAAVGGLMGASVREAIRYGIARGLFSNEAGMGSTPHAHAVAKVKHPGQQGLVAMMGVVVDTGVVCTLTALVILTTNSWKSGLTGIALTQRGFEEGFGAVGVAVIAVTLFFFSVTTIIGWYFFAESNVKYLFDGRGLQFFRATVLLCIVMGTVLQVELVWELADLFNGLMVLPNLLALLGLVGVVVEVARDYEKKY